MSEDIHISFFFQFIQLSPFDREKSDIIFVLFGSCDIYFLVADIEIAAGDDLLAFIPELVDVMDEMLVEFEFIAQHFRTVSPFASVREIKIQQREILELRLDHPPFFMEMLHGLESRYSRNEFQAFLIQGGNPGISWFLS